MNIPALLNGIEWIRTKHEIPTGTYASWSYSYLYQREMMTLAPISHQFKKELMNMTRSSKSIGSCSRNMETYLI